MKLRLFTLFLVLGTSLTSFASTGDLFLFDEDAIDVEFSDISEFENYLLNNDPISFSELETTDQLSQFSLDFNHFEKSLRPMFGFEDIDSRSFLWGCCCWPVGIFTILLDSGESSDNKISFAIGAAITIVLTGGGVSILLL